jgi:transcriptional regulator with XRE-family HTH domain
MALDLSQEHVAHEAGLSVRHYAKIEKGSENATIASLFNIASVMDMNFFDLVRLASRRTSRKRP